MASSRIVRWAALFSVVVYALYVTGATIVLHTDALRSLTKDSEGFHLSTEGGYSLWPGRFHVNGIDLRTQDYKIQLWIRAAEVDLDLGVWSLLDETIFLESVRASGAKLALTYRVHGRRGQEGRLAAFPKIPGFDRSIVYDEPPPPSKPRAYEIRVEDIRASVDEIWLLEYRAQGEMTGHGKGFHLLRDTVNVLPNTIELAKAHIDVGDRTVFDGVSAQIHGEVGPFPARGASAKQIVGSISGSVQTRARWADLSLLDLYLERTPLRFHGSGDLDCDLSVKRGRLDEGSLELSSGTIRMAWNEVPLRGSFHAALDVVEPGLARLSSEIRQTDDSGSADIGLERGKARLDVHHSVLSEPKPGDARFEARGLRVDDPKLLRQLWGDEDSPLLRLAVPEARLTWRKDDQGRSLKARGQLDGSWFPGRDTELAAKSDFEFDCRTEKTTSCSLIRLSARPLAFRRGKDEGTMNAAAEARNFQTNAFETIDSEWAIRGGDPSNFLRQLLDLDFLARFGLSLVETSPLEAELHLNKEGGTFVGSIPGLQSGDVKARGHFVLAEALWTVWLLETPFKNFGITAGPPAGKPDESKPQASEGGSPHSRRKPGRDPGKKKDQVVDVEASPPEGWFEERLGQ